MARLQISCRLCSYFPAVVGLFRCGKKRPSRAANKCFMYCSVQPPGGPSVRPTSKCFPPFSEAAEAFSVGAPRIFAVDSLNPLVVTRPPAFMLDTRKRLPPPHAKWRPARRFRSSRGAPARRYSRRTTDISLRPRPRRRRLRLLPCEARSRGGHRRLLSGGFRRGSGGDGRRR